MNESIIVAKYECIKCLEVPSVSLLTTAKEKLSQSDKQPPNPDISVLLS
jgi:hypothetical protein